MQHAHTIYGPATATIKGKIARKKPKHIEFKQRIPIQPEILKHQSELSLRMDFNFINGHPYFTTITGEVNYRTIIRFRGRGRKDILMRLQAILSRHTKSGFQIN